MTEIAMSKKLTIILVILCSIFHVHASDDNETTGNRLKSSTFPEDGIFSGLRETNVLINPGFENHTSRWILAKVNGGIGVFTTDSIQRISESRSAVVITENTNHDFQDVQLFSHFDLTEKAIYSIKFSAEVKKTCLISITVGNSFDTFYEKKLLLRPETKQYGPFYFSSEVSDPFSFFAFNLGKTKAKIILDDVVIQADHTQREFDNVITRSGINVHLSRSNSENSIFITLPMELSADLPVLLYDEDNKLIFARKIRKGEKEEIIILDESLDRGHYFLKLYGLYNLESYKIELH